MNHGGSAGRRREIRAEVGATRSSSGLVAGPSGASDPPEEAPLGPLFFFDAVFSFQAFLPNRPATRRSE